MKVVFYISQGKVNYSVTFETLARCLGKKNVGSEPNSLHQRNKDDVNEANA